MAVMKSLSKFVMYVINILFWVCAAFLVYAAVKYLNTKDDMANIAHEKPAQILLVAAAVFFVCGLIGIIATCWENKCVLGMFVVIMVITIVLLFGGMIVMVVGYNISSTQINSHFMDLFNQYNSSIVPQKLNDHSLYRRDLGMDDSNADLQINTTNIISDSKSETTPQKTITPSTTKTITTTTSTPKTTTATSKPTTTTSKTTTTTPKTTTTTPKTTTTTPKTTTTTSKTTTTTPKTTTTTPKTTKPKTTTATSKTTATTPKTTKPKTTATTIVTTTANTTNVTSATPRGNATTNGTTTVPATTVVPSNDSNVNATQIIDDIQTNFKCCGFNNYTDWANYTIWISNKKHKHYVPGSCCNATAAKERNTTCPDILLFEGKVNQTFMIYSEGCGAKLNDTFSHYYHFLQWTAMSLAILALLGFLATIYLVFRRRNNPEELGYSSVVA